MTRRKFSTDELFQATKQTLLKYGYEGFTFTLLANHLDVARGTIYRYFDNKEELITNYMIIEMDEFLTDLKEVSTYESFESQFDYLLMIILKRSKIHQILGMAHQIPANTNENVKKNKEKLDELHKDMYTILQSFIRLGRKERLLKPTIADGLILGFIFQSVDIPNHFGIPHEEWIQSIKEIISHGIFRTS